jgi:hypothetical protein
MFSPYELVEGFELMGKKSFLLPPTDVVYAAACKDRGVKPQSEILEDGTRAHWIGNPKAEKLVVNFHGTYLLSPPSHSPFLKQ